MKIAATDVKALRDLTNAGMMDCKNALLESNGDIEKAKLLLREKGKSKADSKSDRVAAQGMVSIEIDKTNKKNALTRVFEKSKIDSKEVEKIIEEIDEIITKERFDGWQNTINGTKLIKRKLFQILYKHKLPDEELKDEPGTVFSEAYNYVVEHY